MFQNITALFDFEGSVEYLPELLRGALVSVELTFCVMLISLVFGLIIALMRLSRPRLPRTVSTIYVEVVRGTPCLLQLFYIYFVLPAFGRASRLACSICPIRSPARATARSISRSPLSLTARVRRFCSWPAITATSMRAR